MQVDRNQAALHAALFLAHSQRTVSSVPVGFPVLNGTTVAGAPIDVLDMSGAILFYDFPLMKQEETVGTVRTAADTVLGHPFVSISTGSTAAVLARRTEAIQRATEFHPTLEVESADLVCFSYPRLGILVTLKAPNDDRVRKLFDPEFPEEGLHDVAEGGSPQREGFSVTSLLATIPEAGAQAASELFSFSNDVLEKMVRAGARRRGMPEAAMLGMGMAAFNDAMNAVLENQPEGLGPPSEKVLSVPHLQQKSSDFCVLACIDMLLRFHAMASPSNQDEIHDILVASPALYAPLGVLPERQVEAFQRCFPTERFSVAIDQSPDWSEARDLINLGLPFKSGIIGHARVCVGYHQAPISTSDNPAPIEVRRSLWINDPSSSQIRLELFEVETSDPTNPAATKTRRAIPLKTNYVTVTPFQS